MWKCAKCEINNAEESSACVICGFTRAESQAFFLQAAAQYQVSQRAAVAMVEMPPTPPQENTATEAPIMKEREELVERPIKMPERKSAKGVVRVIAIVLFCLVLVAVTGAIVAMIYSAMSSENAQTMQAMQTVYAETERSVGNVLSKMWE